MEHGRYNILLMVVFLFVHLFGAYHFAKVTKENYIKLKRQLRVSKPVEANKYNRKSRNIRNNHNSTSKTKKKLK